MSELNIYQKINAVMKKCDYIQKKNAQQGKGVKYDEVIAMLRDLLIECGIVTVMRQKSMECLGGVEGTKQKIYQGEYELDLVNMDKPEEKVTHSSFAQGMDGGDKGPGKAHTYAAKQMLVKGFNIETGEDEESRAEKIENSKVIDANQFNEICILANGNNDLWAKVLDAFKLSKMEGLPSSKFQQAKTMMEKYNANN